MIDKPVLWRVDPEAHRFHLVVPVRFDLRVRSHDHMHANRFARFNGGRHGGRLHLNKLSGVPRYFSIRIWLFVLGSRRRKILGGRGALGPSRLNLQSNGRLAARANVPARFVNPILERIGLAEPRSVLLDASSPDILVGIYLQRLRPMLNGLLKIVGATIFRIISSPVRYAESEMAHAIGFIEPESLAVRLDRFTQPGFPSP